MKKKFMKSMLVFLILLSNVPSSAQVVNVLSWNIRSFGQKLAKGVDTVKKNRLASIEDLLKKEKPTIFCVQEILNDEASKVLTVKLNGKYNNFEKACSPAAPPAHQGNCIFWNTEKFTKLTSKHYNEYSHHPIFVKLELDDSNSKEDGKSFCIFSIHTSFYKGKTSKIEEEIEDLIPHLGTIIKKNGCNHYIVAGDFNMEHSTVENITSGVSKMGKALVEITDDTSRNRSGDSVNNYDHFIISSGLKNYITSKANVLDHTLDTIESQNNGYLASDHYPIGIKFNFQIQSLVPGIQKKINKTYKKNNNAKNNNAKNNNIKKNNAKKKGKKKGK